MWYNIPMNQDAGPTSIITFRFTGKAPRATKTTMEKKRFGKELHQLLLVRAVSRRRAL